MRTRTPKALALLILAVAGAALLGTRTARAEDVNLGTYKLVETRLSHYDADGDGILTRKERRKFFVEVENDLGERAGRILEAVLGRADKNADGRVTRREWEALGDTLGVESAWKPHKTLMVPMTDGVKLATSIHLPSEKGRFPTILVRTPYGKNHGGQAAFVAKGYAVVMQDMRGRFASEGENLPFLACGWAGPKDGADTVAWIRKQKWSNGKVGTFGGSALGITQNLMAGAAPTGLVCQHINVAAASLYHHAAYVGGALRKSQVERWLTQNKFDPEALRLYRAHPHYDEFWERGDSVAKHGAIRVPALHVGGWFDTFSLGTVTAFAGRQKDGAEGARGRQKLVMGPWSHGGQGLFGTVGQLRFANGDAPPAYSAAAWFDHHLLGKDNGVDDLPAVAYYVMGDATRPEAPGNEWRYADTWPVPCEETAWHLLPDGALVRGDSVATTSQPTETPSAGYTFYPDEPCPTVGGCNLVLPAGPRAQNAVEDRADVLTFTTQELTAPVEVTGQARARLFVSCSTADTDLSVRLCDVYPNGKSYLMAEGMLRLRFREGFEEPQPLEPGKVYEVEVELWPTSVVFDRGHRIRLSVTGSNYPRFDVNPGTGRPGRENGKRVKQEVRVFLGGDRQSAILLPVIP